MSDIFTKPKTPPPFGFAQTKRKTEASVWRGSTRDITEAADRVQRRRLIVAHSRK